MLLANAAAVELNTLTRNFPRSFTEAMIPSAINAAMRTILNRGRTGFLGQKLQNTYLQYRPL
jgi:hypothetical protein